MTLIRVASALLDGRLRVLGRPGVPLHHDPRQPAERLPLPRAGDGPPDHRPPRARLLIDPGGGRVARIHRERDRFARLAVNLRCVGRRRPRPAVPEDEGLLSADARLAKPRPFAEGPERPGPALLALGQAEDPLLGVEARVPLGPSPPRLG